MDNQHYYNNRVSLLHHTSYLPKSNIYMCVCVYLPWLRHISYIKMVSFAKKKEEEERGGTSERKKERSHYVQLCHPMFNVNRCLKLQSTLFLWRFASCFFRSLDFFLGSSLKFLFLFLLDFGSGVIGGVGEKEGGEQRK